MLQTLQCSERGLCFVTRAEVGEQRLPSVAQHGFEHDRDADASDQEARGAIGLCRQDAVINLQQGQRQGQPQNMHRQRDRQNVCTQS
uniref:hypothetical protein n=1 Tax=Laribacter hongkongensis TaxID=168471 RepID=UPI00357121AF